MSALASSAPGIYLHVPFCSAICPYCDFAVTTPGGGRRQRYLPALLGEIELVAQDLSSDPPAPPADTVYFGGGTPSLLAPEELDRILRALREHLELDTRPWLGLEANPEDVTPARLAAWRDLGVRFLSLGVQSFDDDSLAFLGRRHTATEARTAVNSAVASGIDTVSIDLIYGLPDQDPDGWSRQLRTAVLLAPQHISCYQLTIEPRTPFAVMRRRGRLSEMAEAEQAALFQLTHDWLDEHGFAAYEISNFATAAGHRSQHNMKYWRHVPYLGLGPSAHSFDGRRRFWNHRQLGSWADAVANTRRPRAGEELLTAEQLALEELMLAIRTTEGVRLDAFRGRHGFDLVAANRATCAALEREGLLLVDRNRLRATRKGLSVADGLARTLAVDTVTAA